MVVSAEEDWLEQRKKFNIRPGLVRIKALLALLGSPQLAYPTIHVAGTNGKGSTVVFTRSILQAHQLRVGTFTSPAIKDFTEQIMINGQPISLDALRQQIAMIRPLVEQLDEDPLTEGTTLFEITTAIAFQYFLNQAVDLAIIEVGMGGLEDSTNVLAPVVTAISTIGLDHVPILGKDLPAIARQKAGIIKASADLVTGNIGPAAMEVIDARAQKVGVTQYRWQTDYQVLPAADGSFTFQNNDQTLADLRSGLAGHYQLENAGLALEVAFIYAKKQKLTLDATKIRQALLEVEWPARMEMISKKPLVILDGAHNVPAMERLIENIKKDYTNQQITIIFSAIITKDIASMLGLLAQLPQVQIIITTFDDQRALNLADYQYLSADNVHLVADWQALVKALLLEPNRKEMTIITGSLYFISHVRKLFIPAEQ